MGRSLSEAPHTKGLKLVISIVFIFLTVCSQSRTPAWLVYFLFDHIGFFLKKRNKNMISIPPLCRLVGTTAFSLPLKIFHFQFPIPITAKTVQPINCTVGIKNLYRDLDFHLVQQTRKGLNNQSNLSVLHATLESTDALFSSKFYQAVFSGLQDRSVNGSDMSLDSLSC